MQPKWLKGAKGLDVLPMVPQVREDGVERELMATRDSVEVFGKDCERVGRRRRRRSDHMERILVDRPTLNYHVLQAILFLVAKSVCGESDREAPMEGESL